MQQKYNQVMKVNPIEFECIFHGLLKEDPEKVLTQYSRDEVVYLALCLNRKFCRQPAEKICEMLSANDSRRIFIMKKLKKLKQKGIYKDVKNIVASEITSLELLRKAFSIPCSRFNVKNKPLDINRLQYQTLKLVTQINEKQLQFKKKEDYNLDIAKLEYINCASNYDIIHFNKQDEFIYQLELAVTFFRLIEKQSRYKYILKGFNDKYKIHNWREYIRTIYSLFGLSLKGEDIIPANMSIDRDSLMTQSVLEAISIPTNISFLPYASTDEYDREGNSDYRIFRDKPLFKLSDGGYAIHSVPLIMDKMYSGLYFDFLHIAETLEGKRLDVNGLFTSEFIEKTLFYELMKQCVDTDVYASMNEDEMRNIYKSNDGELGPPDYYIRDSNRVMLFECKDIRLNGWVKEQRNYELLEEELRNKLVTKTYNLDYDNKCHKSIKKPRRIGCGQIAGHLAKIRRGSFPWDHSLNTYVDIYPVLIIADNRLLADGLSNIIQGWFRECLEAEGINPKHEKPLIIMSPLTLLKYGELFKRVGFEKYFEEYYAYITQTSYEVTDVFSKLISFEDHMSKYSFNLQNKGDRMLKELMVDRQKL